MRIFESIDALTKAAGESLGVGEWHRVTQEQVNQFAEATGDQQWIHTDPERAAQGPFGTTIAHGYLTLALLPLLMRSVYRVDGLAMAVNYGVNNVRFPAPLPVGARVRASAVLESVRPHRGGHQAVVKVTVEREGERRPVCVAETLVLLFSATHS
ncbi:MaoC family dehydratase [Hoyosella rhizosphaerae]|uniref:Enoyl-CoA hydratase 1 n=1 Tax=Hoyosella rhizosphaerae TaxID=1755582 RepID=A0A916U707_9ACTN|nr:MaoC family dehydratase [Hoyosella rhizosphaerae]MBN4926349.1 MaoC family dehydratase [Hoyosella rhizosphaerae]GGC60051.1 putative enoyl-CoA hydratase 1 [Hoyosella rhizosphaerae]